MKTDMPSTRARAVALVARERLRSLRITQKYELEPGQVQCELEAAFMAGYCHGRKMKAVERP